MDENNQYSDYYRGKLLTFWEFKLFFSVQAPFALDFSQIYVFSLKTNGSLLNLKIKYIVFLCIYTHPTAYLWISSFNPIKFFASVLQPGTCRGVGKNWWKYLTLVDLCVYMYKVLAFFFQKSLGFNSSLLKDTLIKTVHSIHSRNTVACLLLALYNKWYSVLWIVWII